MTAEEIEKQEAALAASIREQQELLEAYRKVKAHQISLQAGAQPVLTATNTLANPVQQSRADNSDHLEPAAETTSKADIVRRAIETLSGDFTVNEVYEKLAQDNTSLKKSDVSFVLSRFAKSGEIVQIEQGGGRKPSTYTSRQKNLEGSSTERASTTASHGS
jgi:hypothetical protein